MCPPIPRSSSEKLGENNCEPRCAPLLPPTVLSLASFNKLPLAETTLTWEKLSSRPISPVRMTCSRYSGFMCLYSDFMYLVHSKYTRALTFTLRLMTPPADHRARISSESAVAPGGGGVLEREDAFDGEDEVEAADFANKVLPHCEHLAGQGTQQVGLNGFCWKGL